MQSNYVVWVNERKLWRRLVPLFSPWMSISSDTRGGMLGEAKAVKLDESYLMQRLPRNTFSLKHSNTW